VYVYILRCSDGSYYIGHSVDLAARERTHNEGHGARFTAARRPVEIVYAEEWPNAIAAIRRERQLKRWSTAKKKALVALETRTLKDLARRRA
jgi:predicted GIY-YIG superfamily endonuclease